MNKSEEQLRAALASMATEMPPLTRAPEEVRRRALRRASYVTWATRFGAGLAAVAVTVVIVGGLVLTFRPFDASEETQGGASQGRVATLQVTVDQGVPTAILTYAGASRSGAPVDAIGRGPVSSGASAGASSVTPTLDPITELFGTPGIAVANDVLTDADLEPIALPQDTFVLLEGLDRTVYFLFTDDGSDRWKTLETLTDPAELKELDEGPYRMIVAGMTGDGAVSQFMFDIEVVTR